MAIAVLDVCYLEVGARVACVLADSWASQVPSLTNVQVIEQVEPYRPGSFYRRELPCLMPVLRLLPESPSIIVVDVYGCFSHWDIPVSVHFCANPLERQHP